MAVKFSKQEVAYNDHDLVWIYGYFNKKYKLDFFDSENVQELNKKVQIIHEEKRINTIELKQK